MYPCRLQYLSQAYRGSLSHNDQRIHTRYGGHLRMNFVDDNDVEWTPEKEYRCLWRLRRKLSRILITPILKNKRAVWSCSL